MDKVSAEYAVRCAKAEARGLAEGIAYEQTVEVPRELVTSRAIREEIVGSVESVRPAGPGSFRVVIDYNLRLTGLQIPQLLNLIYGNVSIKRGIRLVDLRLPASFLKCFKGPNFGIAGVRRLLGVYGRPLLATALKPMGTPVARLAAMARGFALGGGDIVKDDQNLSDESFAAFRERVSRCAEAVREANLKTGRNTLYCPIVSAPFGELEERFSFLLRQGVGGALVCPMVVGFDTVRHLAEKYPMVFLAHPALSGAFFSDPGHGMTPGFLLGKLSRLIGADASIFPNFGGRFAFTRQDCREIGRQLKARWSGIKASFPAPAGGMQFGNIGAMSADYGADSVFLVGGALLGHSESVEQGTKAFLAEIKSHFRERLETPEAPLTSACELPSGRPLSLGGYRAFKDFRWQGVEPAAYKRSSRLPFKGVTRHELMGKDGREAAFELRYFEVEPGGYTSLEKHVHTHTIVCLRGAGVLVKDKKLFALKPYDLALVGPLEVHQLRNEGKEPFGFFCIVDRERDRPKTP